MLRVPGLVGVDIPLTGGLDEESPVNKLAPEDCLKMVNWRLSKNGRRIQKRGGLSEEVTTFAEDIFGYSTYFNSGGSFCELAVTESKLKRKVGAGAWADIHSLAATLAHPVRLLEIQGKQFFISEVDSRMIHTDGNDYQIGISAPTTLPTASESYPQASLSLDEHFVYANQGAMDAVWTDADVGNGTSTLSTTDPNSTPGPDADAKYMRLTSSNYSATTVAWRYRTTGNLGDQFSAEFNVYAQELGKSGTNDWMRWDLYTGAFRVRILVGMDGVKIVDKNGTAKTVTTSTCKIKKDAWQVIRFVVDGQDASKVKIETYIDDVKGTTLTNLALADTTYTNRIDTSLVRYAATSVASDIYFDSIVIADIAEDTGALEGTHRYAVTYARSGNYGCESNPIKSVVGTDIFTGAGLNDLTPGGTYTGSVTRTFKVEIDGTGTPDTIKYSVDGGTTWISTTMPITGTMYLLYGVTLTFGATTGHTSGNYWTFTCSCCTGCPTKQKVTLSSIPVSTDPQVDQRKIYRTLSGSAKFFYLATINDNTTTTFVDNAPDLVLASAPELEEDHDVLPNGKFSAWWDDRLWVMSENVLYYSEISIPEEFYIGGRYLPVRRGNFGEEPTGIMPYKDSLYVFFRNAIFAVQKTSLGYGVFQVNNDIGCVAPWSLIEVNDVLMFLSYRGWEIYNGTSVYEFSFSTKAWRTLAEIDTSKYDLITSMHIKAFNEVWLSLPDNTGGADVLVWNYLSTETSASRFYIFQFYKTISFMSDCRNSSKALVNKLCTRDGYVCLCESGYADGSTAITSTYRKGWIESGGKYANWRKLGVEFECPAGKALTGNVYMNFDKDVFRTDTYAGNTPAATDIELRRPINDFSELGLRGQYCSIEFTNAENVGGDLKINEVTLLYAETVPKGVIKGD